MGTDIHVIVQVRDGAGWRIVRHEGEGTPWELYRSPVDGRNYNLFGILANVRNDYDFPPIAEPRGFPDDFVKPTISEMGRYEPEYEEDPNAPYEPGDHSFSWVTLAELDAYDWACVTVFNGVIPEAEYKEWKPRTQPKEWSGDVSGRMVVVMDRYTYDEAKKFEAWGWSDRFAQLPRIPTDKRIHVRIHWPQTAAKAVRDFYTDALPWLRSLGAPEDVRLVFGFDS